MFPQLGYWYAIQDGDLRLRAMLNGHYSARHYKDGRKPKKSIGPGEYMALMTSDSLAVFTWRKFRDDSGQQGINNSIFINKSSYRSSDLIREACQLAWQRWPGERLYTYVNPRRVRSSNPGYCFLCAGWRKCGITKGGLLILEARF